MLSAFVTSLFWHAIFAGATRISPQVHGAPAAARGPLPVLVQSHLCGRLQRWYFSLLRFVCACFWICILSVATALLL
jgi:hypothetical protein